MHARIRTCARARDTHTRSHAHTCPVRQTHDDNNFTDRHNINIIQSYIFIVLLFIVSIFTF